MKQIVTADFKQDLIFEADIAGQKVKMDGNNEEGVWPKPLMLAAICGCSGMDVVSILNKMQVPFTSLKVSVEAGLTEDHPKYYNDIKVIYEVGGEDLSKENVEKAVKLSQDKYCGVLAVFKKAAKVGYEIKYLE